MLHPDTEISRQLVREHHAELEQDWRPLGPPRAVLVETRGRYRRLRLRWLRNHVRPADHAPSEHAPSELSG